MSQYDIYNIFDMASSYMRPSEEQHVTEVVVHEAVIPVIFVPGVMGSNIVNTVDGGGWRVDSAFSVASWITKGAETRKRILNPSHTEIDPEGEVPEGITRRYVDFATRERIPGDYLAKARGWGEVGKMSYGDFLVWLENQLNIDDDADFDTLQTDLTDYYKIVRQLPEAEAEARVRANVHTLGRFNFPVHACGYNWLQSNKDSAATLARRVKDIIAGYQAARMACHSAILVTHSMGGLVARCYSEVDGGKGDLLGIVHGVMPTTGAGVFYRRMKCGTEGSWATSQVLGADGEEMTAVLAQAPGPLQLVPTSQYGRGWLRIETEGQPDISLPTSDDPYTEIYLEREKWWGMMEPEMAMPELETRSSDRQQKLGATWNFYQKIMLDKVKPFHQDLTNKFNSTTYLFYSDSEEYKSYGTVYWQGEDISNRHLRHRAVMRHNQMGTQRTIQEMDVHNNRQVYQRYTVSEPDEPGDGTVPARSGSIGSRQAKESLTVATGHEPAYNDTYARWFTLGSILEIASTWS
ncbi:MAG: esterase/lipase family protein [Pseudomonadota bacterium]